MFWFRQLLGLGFGLAAGLLHAQGMYVILGFFSSMYIISHVYASKRLGLSEEDFPNNELFLEGVGNAFGMFLVSKDLVSDALS